MTPHCTCDLRPTSDKVKQLGDLLRFEIKLVKCALCDAAPDLLAAGKRVLREVQDDGITGDSARALQAAIQKAEAQS